MNTKKILLTIIAVVALGLIISYAIKSPSSTGENYNSESQEINTIQEPQIGENIDDLEADLNEIVDQESKINNELNKLEALSF